MATYVISDIHGNLDVFKKLLEKVNFKYNGEDSLYLLGDYVDWGPKPLETLLFVMELTSKYDFIHPLLGNHDLMFIEQINMRKIDETDLYDNWLFNNGGSQTYGEFLKLPKEEQEKVEDFLKNLPYREDIEVNKKKYILAHACPVEKFKYNNELPKEENLRILEDYKQIATWTRITRRCSNVLKWFDRENKHNFDSFICGHTISQNLYDGHLHIEIKEKNYINIDCGAKVLGYDERFEDAKYARLAMLRLDDFKEFYEK